MRALKRNSLQLTAFFALIVTLHSVSFAGSGAKFDNITAVGASNTAGVGASTPLIARIRYHLQKVAEPAVIQAVMSPKTLIAVDYFFMTNYSDLDNPKADHEAFVNKTLDAWAAENDRILVALLPTWSQVTDPMDVAFAKNAVTGFKNILDMLSAPERIKAVEAVDRAIMTWARNHPNYDVRILDLTKMISAAAKQYRNRGAIRFYEPFNDDQIHFNNAGQALLFNSVIRENLESRIPEMSERVSKSEVLSILSTMLNLAQHFAEHKEGAYWAQFTNKANFSAGQYKLNIPAQTSNKELLAKQVGTLNDIAKTIEGNLDISEGFPLYLRSSPRGPQIGLDLVKSLFYTLIYLKSSDSNRFIGWGYDFWYSVSLTNPPRVNYRFEVIRDPARPLNVKVIWTLFPPAIGQPTPKERLSILDEKWQKAVSDQNVYPSLTYEIETQIINLK